MKRCRARCPLVLTVCSIHLFLESSYLELWITKRSSRKYIAITGNTSTASILRAIPNDAFDYLYRDGIRHVPYFIYPCLNSTSLDKSAGDPDYETSGKTPAGAQNGSTQHRLPASGEPGRDPALWDIFYTVTMTVTNTGEITGDEVSRLYVGLGGLNDAKV